MSPLTGGKYDKLQKKLEKYRLDPGIKYLEAVSFADGVLTVATKYLHHTHNAASLGTASTSDVAPSSHTHTYDKTTSVSLTAGTPPSLTANSTSASALATYLQAYSVSGGGATATTKYMNATFAGSSGTTSTPSGTQATPYSANSVQYITDPTQITGPNTDGLKFVVTTTEPATKYDGYYYIVKES